MSDFWCYDRSTSSVSCVLLISVLCELIGRHSNGTGRCWTIIKRFSFIITQQVYYINNRNIHYQERCKILNIPWPYPVMEFICCSKSPLVSDIPSSVEYCIKCTLCGLTVFPNSSWQKAIDNDFWQKIKTSIANWMETVSFLLSLTYLAHLLLVID